MNSTNIAASRGLAGLAAPEWKSIYPDVSSEEFLDYRWQLRHSVTSVAMLADLLRPHVSASFLEDVAQGLRQAPMALRLTPYLLSLVDWTSPVQDPIRRQFLPLASEYEPDSAHVVLDSLGEQRDSVAPGLTHRYPDRVLLLALNTCPVYCRFCTRSYAVGDDTGLVNKLTLGARAPRWAKAIEYIAANPQVEDVVVSGGDAYFLRADEIRWIGDALLGIPHVRRLRFATKGPAVLPQKFLGDVQWRDALFEVHAKARQLDVQVALHVHFNHPRQITSVTAEAMRLAFQQGMSVRNQSVLLRGVNDDFETMSLLIRRLSMINVQPYYVYLHDMVPGVECLRTTVADAVKLEHRLRGTIAGFLMPTFVVDLPGGGGKRPVGSYLRYDREAGIAEYEAPGVAPGVFRFYDPIRARY